MSSAQQRKRQIVEKIMNSILNVVSMRLILEGSPLHMFLYAVIGSSPLSRGSVKLHPSLPRDPADPGSGVIRRIF